MASKKHNPGCPCCGGDECVAADGTYGPFTNTPTIRIVISGLPSSYEFKYFNSPFPFTFNERYEYDLVGMDSANGTFFWPLGKNESGCITFIGGYFASYATSDNEVTKVYTLACGLTTTTGSSTTPGINVDGTSVFGPKYTVAITMSGRNYRILGQIEFTPVTGYAGSLADNTVTIGGTSFSGTWARGSGDIKIIRMALPADFCDLPAENPDNYVFETIGHISAEIIDL